MEHAKAYFKEHNIKSPEEYVNFIKNSHHFEDFSNHLVYNDEGKQVPYTQYLTDSFNKVMKGKK